MSAKNDTKSLKTNTPDNVTASAAAEDICLRSSNNGSMVTLDSGSYTLAIAVTAKQPWNPEISFSENTVLDPVIDPASAVVPASLPPSILLAGAAKGVAATNSVLGSKMWGPELQVLGMPFNLSAVSLPPWPLVIARGGQIDHWAASFDVIETVGVGVPGIKEIIALLRASNNPAASALITLLTLLGPLGTLTTSLISSITNILGDVLTPPSIHAQLIHAKPATNAFDALFQSNWTVVDDINLGEIPLVSVFSTFHGTQKLAVPYVVAPGDYLLVRYYLDTNLAAEAYGFHAGACIDIF